MSAASEDHGPAHAVRTVGAGHRGSGPGTTSPRLPHTPLDRSGVRDKRREGARRGHHEKSGPVRQERPSLVWRDFGPAQESATSPHRSVSQSVRRATGHRAPKVGEGHGEDHHQRSLLQPHRHTTAPPSSRATPVADDPARRTPDTWHRACGGGGSSQPPPGALRRGEVESHGLEDPRATPRAPPPSGEPETGGGTAGRVSRAHTQAHTRAGAQAQAGGSRGKGTGSGARRRPAAHSPDPCVRPEPQSPQRLDAREHRVSTYLVAKKAHFGRKISQRPGAGPIHESRGGPRNLGPATCPQLVPIHTSPGALGGYLVDPRSVATKWGRGNVGGGGERQRAGRGRPPRFARPPARAGTGPPRSLRAKTRFKKKKMSHTRPPPTSGPHEGPHEGPCLSLRVTPRGPGQRSKG